MKNASYSRRHAKIDHDKCWIICLFQICDHLLYSLDGTALSKPAVITKKLLVDFYNMTRKNIQNKTKKSKQRGWEYFQEIFRQAGLFFAISLNSVKAFHSFSLHNASITTYKNKKTYFFKRRLCLEIHLQHLHECYVTARCHFSVDIKSQKGFLNTSPEDMPSIEKSKDSSKKPKEIKLIGDVVKFNMAIQINPMAQRNQYNPNLLRIIIDDEILCQDGIPKYFLFYYPISHSRRIST